MRRFFVNENCIKNDTIEIADEQFEHLSRVLRLKVGDKIVCFTGNGFDYDCEISQILTSRAICKIEQIVKSEMTPTHKVTLFQGALKNDKFEFVIQKMSELGISEIYPFDSVFTVAKIKDEKIERYQKIASEASKQCQRADILQVKSVLSFKNMVSELKKFDLVIFAYEKEKQNSLSQIDLKNYNNIALIVGSEGGFSEKEANILVENGVKSITLGNRILRAETAPITLASIVMFLLGEMS